MSFDHKIIKVKGENYKITKCFSESLVNPSNPVWWIEDEDEQGRFKTLNNASNSLFTIDGDFAINHSARKVIVGDIL